MGIEAKHAYRFGYLKSEHWQNLRLSKLAETGARCFFCGKEDNSNDVHHIHYPDDLHSVDTKMLRVLCRVHHDRVHELMTAMELTHPMPSGASKRNHDFKIFRLLSGIIESEVRKSGIRPCSREGRLRSAHKIVVIDTDKCPHTIRAKKSKEHTLILKQFRNAVKVLNKMERGCGYFHTLPDSAKADYSIIRECVDRISRSIDEFEASRKDVNLVK